MIPEVRPSAGGADADDFAAMLTAMYRAYDGDRDLGREVGYHRLVRYSPHDPQRRRQTSFAHVGPPTDEPRHVRSYILDPYTLARNLFDDREVADVHAILSGSRLGELL